MATGHERPRRAPTPDPKTVTDPTSHPGPDAGPDSTSDLTPRELDVMSVLWRVDAASVADVREALADDLAYTSVLTVLQGLERKGHVTHEAEGRKYLYRALTSSREAGAPLLDRLLRSLYRRSPVRLVAHLVDGRKVTDDELREIRRLIDERLGDDAPGDTDGGRDGGHDGTSDGEGRA